MRYVVASLLTLSVAIGVSVSTFTMYEDGSGRVAGISFCVPNYPCN